MIFAIGVFSAISLLNIRDLSFKTQGHKVQRISCALRSCILVLFFLAAPKYSFYFVQKGIRLFYLIAFIHQTQADTAMWDRRVDFPDNFKQLI
jgi:hypothetical protein